MIRSICALFLTALLTLSPLAAMAQDAPIGALVEVEGDGALIMRAAEQGKAYPAKADDPVYANDVLQTGPGGRMLALLIDDSQFTLGENSRFKVDEYAYDDEDNTNNMARYNVLQGTFLYVSGLVAKKENPDVKIATPYGSIGIRGTTVWGGPLEDEFSVFTSEGEVTFETNRGRIRIPQGEGSVIRNINSIPERTKIWAPEKIAKATNTVGFKNVERVKQRIAIRQQAHAAMVAKHRDLMRAKRAATPGVPRAGSTKEIRPLRQNAPQGVPPAQKLQEKTPSPALKEKIREKALEEKRQDLPQKRDASTMPFPKPDGPVENIFPDNLPTDPAKRQEAIERTRLQKQQQPQQQKPAVRPRQQKHSPL